MLAQKLEKWVDNLIFWIIALLMIAIPVAFSIYTRSIFEVLKLMILQIGLLAVIGLLLTKELLLLPYYFRNNVGDGQEHLSGWRRWIERHQWIGFEIPLLIWILVNMLSAVLSTNIYLALIGTYDRWEGLFTTMLYFVFLWLCMRFINTRSKFYQFISANVIAVFICSAYGIVQNTGNDFMSWSFDPVNRVFGSINNPVHYCAYVGMATMFLFGLTMFMVRRNEINPKGSKYMRIISCAGLLALTGMVFYTQIISYSRATFVGLYAGLAFFLLTVLQNVRWERKLWQIVLDYGLTILIFGMVLMLFLFRLYLYGPKVWIPMGIIMSLYLIYQFWNFSGNWRQVLLRVMIIWISVELHNVSINFIHLLIFFLSVGVLYWLSNKNQTVTVRRWIATALIMLSLLMIVLVFPQMWAELFGKKADAVLAVSNNMRAKVASIGNSAVETSPRASMWKSAMVWWLYYPVYGSGPDSVKVQYPQFRRFEYGRREGGNNYTPDRVHNEYFNNMITKGGIGFLTYYFGIVLLFVVYMIKGFRRYHKTPHIFILASMLAGVFVYLGQVLFNFGVAVTFVYLYTLMGCGVALVRFGPQIIENKDLPLLTNSNDHISSRQISTTAFMLLPVVWIAVLYLIYRSVLPFMADHEYRLGDNAYGMGKENIKYYALSADWLDKAIKDRPWETTYLIRMGKVYEDWGATLTDPVQKQEKITKALAFFEHCIDLDQTSPWYMNRASAMHFILGGMSTDPQVAANHYFWSDWLIRRSAIVDDQNPLFRVNLASYMMRSGRDHEAELLYRSAIIMDPPYADAHYGLAQIFNKTGRFEEAEKFYLNAIKQDPTHPEFYMRLGYLYHQQQKLDKAVEVYSQGLAINPNDESMAINLSYILIGQGQWKEALPWIEKSAQLKSQSAEIWFNYGVVLDNLGRTADAVRAVEKSVSVDPNYESARRALMILRNKLQVRGR